RRGRPGRAARGAGESPARLVSWLTGTLTRPRRDIGARARPGAGSRLPDPLPVVPLHPVVRARALLAGLRERGLHAGRVARRNLVLLHERVVDHVPVDVLGADQLRDLRRPAPLARPVDHEPPVRLADAALVLPLANRGP